VELFETIKGNGASSLFAMTKIQYEERLSRSMTGLRTSYGCDTSTAHTSRKRLYETFFVLVAV